jgi:hypothetical protein
MGEFVDRFRLSRGCIIKQLHNKKSSKKIWSASLLQIELERFIESFFKRLTGRVETMRQPLPSTYRHRQLTSAGHYQLLHHFHWPNDLMTSIRRPSNPHYSTLAFFKLGRRAVAQPNQLTQVGRRGQNVIGAGR